MGYYVPGFETHMKFHFLLFSFSFFVMLYFSLNLICSDGKLMVRDGFLVSSTRVYFQVLLIVFSFSNSGGSWTWLTLAPSICISREIVSPAFV